jgi:TonB family protein
LIARAVALATVTLAALALPNPPTRGYSYVGAADGSAAVIYARDSIWVYVSSHRGPFAFGASTATMAAWADSATTTRFPHGTTARFQYYDAAARDTIILQLTRESGDSAPAYQCMALVAGWSGAIVFTNDSAQRFFALLHGPPEVSNQLASLPPDTYFDYQVTQQVRPTRESGQVVYPAPLARAGVSGQALVQFVVDTTGLVDLSTFKVLKTTNRWFASAVYDALPRMRFAPAQVKGAKVRELVQEPYPFNVW